LACSAAGIARPIGRARIEKKIDGHLGNTPAHKLFDVIPVERKTRTPRPGASRISPCRSSQRGVLLRFPASNCESCPQDEAYMNDWQDRIGADPDTLFGKPRIRGTRIGVIFLLDLLASGWSEAQILDSYPHLQQQDLQAVFAFARDCMRDETFIMRAAAESGQVPV
jgi:uncharacterized protein (DUF433 family)